MIQLGFNTQYNKPQRWVSYDLLSSVAEVWLTVESSCIGVHSWAVSGVDSDKSVGSSGLAAGGGTSLSGSALGPTSVEAPGWVLSRISRH